MPLPRVVTVKWRVVLALSGALVPGTAVTAGSRSITKRNYLIVSCSAFSLCVFRLFFDVVLASDVVSEAILMCFFKKGWSPMAVEITGIVKYARHMKGSTPDGKAYEFFSFIVLDTEEGVKWPLQLQSDHPQFAELASHEKELEEQRVRVVVRSFSAGYRLDKKTGQKEPQARFYAKSVQVVATPAAR